MARVTGGQNRDSLCDLKDEVSSHKDWWLFPAEGPIHGFMGRGPIFIVGDQPSNDEWPPEHPNRRIFYDTLHKLGLGSAHLTDFYKRRGRPSALEHGLPADFPEHLSIFRREIEILQPKRIIALGQLAQRLLIQNLPEWKLPIRRIYHFAHIVKAGKESQYEANMREIIFD